MNWYKSSQYKEPQIGKDEILSWFGTSREEIDNEIRIQKEQNKHKIIYSPESIDKELVLYRGFYKLPELINGEYIFSSEKSEQGVLWFTHELISRNYDELEYAKDHGNYLLTYVLDVKQHIQRICYDNNDKCIERIPIEIEELTNSIENCRYYMGYELPEGWYFSYKMEKFIVCDHDIYVKPSMIMDI